MQNLKEKYVINYDSLLHRPEQICNSKDTLFIIPFEGFQLFINTVIELKEDGETDLKIYDNLVQKLLFNSTLENEMISKKPLSTIVCINKETNTFVSLYNKPPLPNFLTFPENIKSELIILDLLMFQAAVDTNSHIYTTEKNIVEIANQCSNYKLTCTLI